MNANSAKADAKVVGRELSKTITRMIEETEL